MTTPAPASPAGPGAGALVVHARFVARPGRGEDLLDAVAEMLRAARGERETLAYAIHRDRDTPEAVVMYEVYASDAGLDAHGASAAAGRFGAALDELLAEEPIAWFTRPWAATGIADLLGLPEGETATRPG